MDIIRGAPVATNQDKPKQPSESDFISKAVDIAIKILKAFYDAFMKGNAVWAAVKKFHETRQKNRIDASNKRRSNGVR